MPSRKLAKYRAKRDFGKTAEPSGDMQKAYSGHSYLIQKHAARGLHYDFRLEMDGTLKSWAVTKGPSLNPADKRLAVHVEDHPLAPLMLEQIKGRPISLVRCPAGEGKPCFFQRHGAETLSPFVKPVKLPGEKEPYLMVEDARGLAALVQMGVLRSTSGDRVPMTPIDPTGWCLI